MNCLRNKTNFEIHLLFYLILTVILCTSIVSYVYYQSKHSKQKCFTQKTVLNETNETKHGLSHEEYADLNYQPIINDKRINSLIFNMKNSIELMRKTFNIPCVLVGISINGTDLWTEGIGSSDVENGVKCHKHSAFSLGSMSKPIISLLMASLIDSGQVDLDQSINPSDYFEPTIQYSIKEMDDNSTSFLISLTDLMSEKADLPIRNSTDCNQYCGNSFNNYGETVSKSKLEYNKSTLSWTVITKFIESVTNQSFETVFNDFVFKKLHLISSAFLTEDSLIPYRVRYYKINGLELQNCQTKDEIPVHYLPSAAITSTVPEILMFGRDVIRIYQQNNDSVINSTSFKRLIRRQIQHPIYPDIYFGLGWMLFDNSPDNYSHIFGYEGQTSGSSYLFIVRPDNQFVITLFANLGGIEDKLYTLAKDITSKLLGRT